MPVFFDVKFWEKEMSARNKDIALWRNYFFKTVCIILPQERNICTTQELSE